MRLHFAIAHERLHPTHGPQTWPWWRLVSFSVVRLSPVQPPNSGYALWVYTRWGAWWLDVYVDRCGRYGRRA